MPAFKTIIQYLFNNLSLFFFGILIIFTFDRHHRYEATSNPELGPFESDVAEYYSFLPLLFYGNPAEIEFNFRQNKRTIGMAMMYLPAFAVGDLLARVKGEKTNGYSEPYHWSIRWGSIILCIAGLWLTRLSLRKFFSDLTVAIALTCVFFGTNLFYYTYSTGEMPHSYLFFLYSAFLFLSLEFIINNKYRTLPWLGLTSGMIILIRPTAGLILLFFFLFRVYTFSNIKSRLILLVQSKAQLYVSSILFMTPILLQMVLWNKYNGSYFYYSYKDERFFFNDPQIINFLFSYRKGWLIYTPIMIFSIIGIILSVKHLKDFTLFLILFTTANIYILSSWWEWSFGGSFGCRALVESYAIMAFPFALFIDWSWKLFQKNSLAKAILRSGLIVIIILLIKLNLFQTWQYKYLIIHWSGMNEKAYKYVFLREVLTKDELIYLHDTLATKVDADLMKKGIRNQ